MHRTRYAYTKQLKALLLMAVMLLVHITKMLHTHASHNQGHQGKQEKVVDKAGPVHSSCTICEFHFAKDAPFTGDLLLVIAPVHTSAIYSRLLTAINPDRLFISEGRGPPRV